MVCYPVLIGEMAKREIKKKSIAEALGICDKTLKNKLAGRTPFTWPEIKEIQQQFFPDMQMEVLFKTNTDVGEELEE